MLLLFSKQLIGSSTSRVLQKLIRCFNDSAIFMSFAPASLVLLEVFDLNLNDSESATSGSSLQYCHKLSDILEQFSLHSNCLYNGITNLHHLFVIGINFLNGTKIVYFYCIVICFFSNNFVRSFYKYGCINFNHNHKF